MSHGHDGHVNGVRHADPCGSSALSPLVIPRLADFPTTTYIHNHCDPPSVDETAFIIPLAGGRNQCR